jgi:hypothetical protein
MIYHGRPPFDRQLLPHPSPNAMSNVSKSKTPGRL